jgi:hypothetical protein
MLHVTLRDWPYMRCLNRDHIERVAVQREDLYLIGSAVFVDVDDRSDISRG